MQSIKFRQSNSLLKQRQSPLPLLETKLLCVQPTSLSPQQQQMKMHQITFHQRLRMYYKSTHTLTPKPWNLPHEEQGTGMRLISVQEVMKAQKKLIQMKMTGSRERVFQHKRFNTDSSKISAEFQQKAIKFNLKLSQNEQINVIRSNSFGPWESLN